MKNNLQKRIQQNDRKFVVAYALALSIMIGLSLIANYIIKEQVAIQVSTLIRRMVKSDDYREIVYTLSSARIDHFDAVGFQTKDNKRLFTIPANVDPNFFRRDVFINSISNTYLPIKIYFDENKNDTLGTIIFVFNRFSYVPAAIALWLLLAGLSVPFLISYRKKLLQAFNEEVVVQNQMSKIEMGKKVRHDIRSPLAALQGIWAAAELDFETKKNLGLTVIRMEEIISDLEESTTKKKQFLIDEISQVVTEVIKEKKLFIDAQIAIHLNCKVKVFAKIVRSDLKRTVSNIIDNSLQAGCSEISIRVENQNSNVLIEVADNGSGIPMQFLTKVKQKGFTFGKVGGSGSGLFYADETMKLFNGSLEINSSASGTKVSLIIPAVEKPLWYINEIVLKSGDTVILLDDQKTNNGFWELAFSTWITDQSITLKSFSDSEDFKNWKVSKSTGKEFYLVDYDLGENKENGLYLINLFGIKDRAFLVTGNYDDTEVQNGCEEIGCKLLPKGRIPEISVL